MFIIILAGIVSAGPGAIWTTRGDCGDSSQDVNKYAVGEDVYINGNNFVVGTYDWAITGQPGSLDPNMVVASGSDATNSNGAFCFKAYTVKADDGGVYTVDFDGKNDNYHVEYEIEEPPTVPEFGAVVGVLTVLGAVGMFLVVRKK